MGFHLHRRIEHEMRLCHFHLKERGEPPTPWLFTHQPQAASDPATFCFGMLVLLCYFRGIPPNQYFKKWLLWTLLSTCKSRQTDTMTPYHLHSTIICSRSTFFHLYPYPLPTFQYCFEEVLRSYHFRCQYSICNSERQRHL
jgi:hypothetical protein